MAERESFERERSPSSRDTTLVHQSLLQLLEPRPPFGVLVVSEQKSLGREILETGYLIKRLSQAGVEIVEYVHGQSLTPKNWQDKAMSAMRSAADEAHPRADARAGP